jgi:hypothetical protein
VTPFVEIHFGESGPAVALVFLIAAIILALTQENEHR